MVGVGMAWGVMTTGFGVGGAMFVGVAIVGETGFVGAGAGIG